MNRFRLFFPLIVFSCISTFISSCKDDDVPPVELEEEEISRVILTFTPTDGGAPVSMFTWVEGEGAEEPTADLVLLNANTTYTLSMELLGPNNENVTEEIEEEADEHMFFFGWTEGLFSSPVGSGNITSRSGTVNYEDQDAKGLPLGLVTSWTTGDAATGTFTTILKHQPNAKTATSTVNDGATDLEIDWNITIK